MTRLTRMSATALLALSLAACADGPTAPAPEADLAKLNGSNGFAPFLLEINDDFICAGDPDVWTSLTGYVKVASVSPRPGGGVRIVEILSNGRISLTGNGKTLTSAMSGTAVYEINANDELERITFPGSNGVFTAPGWGRILAETGHLVLDGSGNIIKESGPHEVFGNNPNVAKLCAYLGS